MYNDKRAINEAKDIYEKYRNTEEDELYNDDVDEDYEEQLFAPPIEVDPEGYVKCAVTLVKKKMKHVLIIVCIFFLDSIPNIPICLLAIPIMSTMMKKKRTSRSWRRNTNPLRKQRAGMFASRRIVNQKVQLPPKQVAMKMKVFIGKRTAIVIENHRVRMKMSSKKIEIVIVSYRIRTRIAKKLIEEIRMVIESHRLYVNSKNDVI